MINFIGGVVVLLCVIGCVVWFVNKWRTANKAENKPMPFGNLDEHDLISRFNSLVDSLMNGKAKRGIDEVAKEMLDVLKEYKNRKIEQFVESEQMLTKNKRELAEQIARISNQISQLKADALALKKDNMTEDDYENGALYMAQIDETEKLKKELQQTAEDNDERLAVVDRQVKNFRTRYILKETSIKNMIIKAKTQKNFSNVDLRLNDLITEFNDKVEAAEIETKVRTEIQGNTEHEEDVNVQFIENKDKYIEEYKKLLGK